MKDAENRGEDVGVKWVLENIADNQGGIFGLVAEKGSAKKDLTVGLRQRNFPIREVDWREGTFFLSSRTPAEGNLKKLLKGNGDNNGSRV